MFRRKIYDTMLEWKRRSRGRTALLVEGARRVGKTTVIGEFGRREYKSVAMVDFTKPNRRVVSAIRRLFAFPFICFPEYERYDVCFDWVHIILLEFPGLLMSQ